VESLFKIFQEIDLLMEKYMRSKSLFPYVDETFVGKREMNTAPIYSDSGLKVRFHFSQPLTLNDVEKINEVGHYLNQNVIFRLYALLESYNLFATKIDQSIDGWKELDLVRRLRNHFAHTSGEYDPAGSKQKKLVEELVTHFKLGIKEPQDIPLSINEVIIPLFNGCKKYIKDKFEKGNLKISE
jgi:hypothetical protein